MNMAIDEGLLRLLEEVSIQKTTVVRFYRWDVPTISLGKNQKAWEAVDLAYCQSRGLPLVYRPTGGRAVFHGQELTYAVVSNDRKHFALHNPLQTYWRIATALQMGLRRLSCPTDLSPTVRPTVLPVRATRKPCFLSASRYELLSGGRKLVGSAQRRLKGCFLQHGSIPLHIDYQTMAAALGISETLLRSKVVSVSEGARHTISFEALCSTLMKGFEEVFRVKLSA